MKTEKRMKRFGGKVREERLNSGYLQSDIATTIGVTSAMISEIERGNKMPSLFVAHDLAKALHISLDELLSK